MTEHFFKCPDTECKCFFFTRSDLKRHLWQFGQIHARALAEIHQTQDNHYSGHEFDDADRTQQDFAAIIRKHYGAPNR